MAENMPEWAKDLEKNLKAAIDQKFDQTNQKIDQNNQKLDQINQRLTEHSERISKLEIKRGIATELKPVQENDGAANHKSDKGDIEPKPMEDPDEVKANKVEVINIDQSDGEVFKLSTDKTDGENSSELAINDEGFKKDEIIVPYCSLFPSTTTTSHTLASSPPLLVFVLTPLHNPPHHSLPHQHCYYQSNPPPPLTAQPDLSTAPHCCHSILPFFLHLDMFIISASDEKCQHYLICWKDHPSSDDSWNSRNKLWWLDPDLFERFQNGLIQDPTASFPFDPGGIADDHVARGLPPTDLTKLSRRSPFCNSTESSFLSPREN